MSQRNESNEKRKMSPKEFIDSLRRPVESPPGLWKADCPMHEDDQRSLLVRFDKSGNPEVECEKGCDPEDVFRNVGCQPSDFKRKDLSDE